MAAVEFGYHASHEQFAPARLLQLAQQAERAGFDAVLSSDHLMPWGAAQGHSAFAWSWLGAALQATRLPFGVVSAPVGRYHPVIIAQAVATLLALYPGRFVLCAGSGQALNEHVTGAYWPPKPERNARLQEAVAIMRRLWAGETVEHRGLVRAEQARLYVLPAEMPRVIGAALTPQTAEWLGGWADGLITTSRPTEALREMIAAFRRGGGAGKPLYLKVQLSYAADEEAARREAYEQWRTTLVGASVSAELRAPEQFDEVGRLIGMEEVARGVRISSRLEQHIAWLQGDVALGFERIFLHNVGSAQEAFITAFGETVLPALRRG